MWRRLCRLRADAGLKDEHLQGYWARKSQPPQPEGVNINSFVGCLEFAVFHSFHSGLTGNEWRMPGTLLCRVFLIVEKRQQRLLPTFIGWQRHGLRYPSMTSEWHNRGAIRCCQSGYTQGATAILRCVKM